MKYVISIIKSFFLTAVNYMLLGVGSLLIVMGAVLGNLYIPVLATVPMLIVGLFSIPGDEFGAEVILGAILMVFVLKLIFPFLLAIYQILITISSSIGSVATGGGQSCFRLYEKNDSEICLNKRNVPKQTYFLFVFYYILKAINLVIRVLLRLLLGLSIMVSLGVVGYCIYSYTVEFSDSFAMMILPRLEYFATDTVWGNYVLGILLLLTIIGTLVKSTSDIKLYVEEMEVEKYESANLHPQDRGFSA